MSATKSTVKSWRGYEARTHDGRLVSFSGPSDLTPQQQGWIRAAIGRTEDLSFPEAHRVNVAHGGYGRYTRYNIEQTKYAGGRRGYVECMCIRDAPDGRCAHIIYKYNIHGNSSFFEFDTQKAADKAWEECVDKGRKIEESLREQPGFIRAVYCDVMTPWFYAVGNQELVGDWTFPEYSQQHPYFAPGHLYVVQDAQGQAQVKCCIGSRIIDRVYGDENYSPVDAVLVFWDDGTHFSSEQKNGSLSASLPLPRRVDALESEMAQALGEFRELLASTPHLALEVVRELQRRQRDQLGLI